jgi:hypothetical protein
MRDATRAAGPQGEPAEDPYDAPLPDLARIVQTCQSCPSQWNAWDASGQYYYLRYRCGRGTVETAASPEDYVNPDTWSTTVREFHHGDQLEGEIELDQFLELAQMRLAPGVTVC